jgi:5,10-methylenetetrahydromethanopterin reductase
VKFGVVLQATDSVRQIAERARLCEELGFDFVGITDGQMIWHDVYVALTAAAQATRRIRLGPWVTNPLTRHPTVTACAMSSLLELSEGRAFLGIGAGDDSVRTIGRKPVRLDELAEAVELIRKLAAGQTVETPHGVWSLAAAQGHLTIYWTSANARSLGYGGRYGDGTIVSGWLAPEVLSRMRNLVLEGARKAGRPTSDTVTIFNSAISIDDNRAAALAAAKPYVARALCHPASTWMADWSEANRAEFQSQYDFYHHFRPDHDLAQLVPDEMVTRKAVAGTPEDCATLLRRVIAEGYQQIALMPAWEVETTVRRYATEVLPRL